MLIENEISKQKQALHWFDGALKSHSFHLVHVASHETLNKFTPQQNDHLFQKLRKSHRRTWQADPSFTKKMLRCLSPNVLIHYITSAIVTCICAIMIMLAEATDKLIFGNNIIASTNQLFVYSIGGKQALDNLVIAFTDTNVTRKFANWFWC